MNEENKDFDFESIPKVKRDKKKVIGGLLLGAIPLLFILYLVLGPVLHILSKDLSAKEMYVISEFVNVRATSDINSLKMGKAQYGTKLLVYDIKKDFAEVLIDGQKGFVSSEFIADPSTYFSIEGLFGDNHAESLITSTKYKLGLLRYLESKGYISNIPEEIKNKQSGDQSKKEAYQIFIEPRGSHFNASVFSDFDGDFQNEAAFVLKNVNSDKKILVILWFDKKDPLKLSKAIYETELKPWYFIKLAKKGTKYQLGSEVVVKGKKPEKFKIPVNGLIIGSNRSKDINDPEYLLLYNGDKFEMHDIVKEEK